MSEDDWIAAFEAEGEDAVRLKLAASHINIDGTYVAVKWLAQKDHESRERRDRMTKRDRAIETAALIMATVAAIAAIVGAIAAIMALRA